MTLRHLLLSSLVCLLPTVVCAQAGVVTFTFDDSRSSQYEIAFPIMDQFDIQGTLFALPPEDDRLQQGGGDYYINWDQLREMRESGWDIQSHTYSHRDLVDLSDVELYGELVYSQHLLEKELGIEIFAVASPYGSFDERVLQFIRSVYQVHFRAWGGNEGLNDLAELDWYDVGRFEVKNTYAASDVCVIVERAGIEGTWLVLEFHGVVPDSPGEYDVTARFFEEIINCTSELREDGDISIETVSQVFHERRKE